MVWSSQQAKQGGGNEKEKLSTKRSERLQDDCGREQNETRESSKSEREAMSAKKGENSQNSPARLQDKS